MLTVLLIIIYISFISLGLPDSLLGSAWPAVHSDLGVQLSFAAYCFCFLRCPNGSCFWASALWALAVRPHSPPCCTVRLRCLAKTFHRP